MNKDRSDLKSKGGLRRLVNAFGYFYAGFRQGFAHEASIRQELFVLVIFLPVAILLPVSNLEHLILVLSMMLVVLVEFLNSAIEATVDRISVERHPLSAQAKDLASVAVGISISMTGLCWLVIAGPVVLRWLGCDGA
ncbi:MAG: diacylglycerol kinase [Proteobacteria bacterium]|nr:diacylglycerol kinase [Pseudomonadota bacterium]MBU4468969.1 diacylglycerol kinase [Pseudomonadota bacterium]MCG2752101.1 diacylglycerol kinase [Desulfobacteraceae bacterium]